MTLHGVVFANPPIDFLQQIRDLRQQGQLETAIRLSHDFLKTHPKDVDVMLMLGLMDYQKHNFQEAGTLFRQVLLLSPNYLDAKLALIRVLVAQNQLQEAETLLSSATKQAPPQNPRILDLQIFLKKAVVAANSPLPSEIPTIASQLEKPAPAPAIATNQKYAGYLKMITALRLQKNYPKAIQLGEIYLKESPKDTDVLLQLGLIYLQQKHYDLARSYFNRALTISPYYVDVKIGLTNIALAQKKLHRALTLLLELMKAAPNNPDVKALQKTYEKAARQNKFETITELFSKKKFKEAEKFALLYLQKYPDDTNVRLQLGNIYLAEKQYDKARGEFKHILQNALHNKPALLALIDADILSRHTFEARQYIWFGLSSDPFDADFLAKKAEIAFIEHNYAIAADKSKRILQFDPNHQEAKRILNEMKDINPHELFGLNEVGASTLVWYASDIKEFWQFTNAFYNRNTPLGGATFMLNNASRLGFNASQGMINLTPSINRDLYFSLTGAYANQPILFPTWYGGIEGFYSNLPLAVSAGYTYSFILPQIAFTTYTGSLTKEWGDNLLSFRPYHYSPERGKKSTLYTGTFYHYFHTRDAYINLSFGKGTSPDLANLATVDFIVINNTFFSVTVQTPLFNHRLLASLGFSYQHWVFDRSGRIRDLTGGVAAIRYKF